MAAVKVGIQVEQVKLRGLAASYTASLHTADALIVGCHHKDEPVSVTAGCKVRSELRVSPISVGDKNSLKENCPPFSSK